MVMPITLTLVATQALPNPSRHSLTLTLTLTLTPTLTLTLTLVKVSKSGKHASFDLQITREDRLGCVRPFGSRQIRFIFSPSLAGPFRETLTVLNAQDPTDQQEVVVKAEVR